MKKKLLLIALPALMVLSGCANVQKEQPKVEEQPVVEFEEDTVAHEEIFGEAVEAKPLAIRKMGELDDKSAYKVGYQIHFDDKGDGDASNDVISIRFVAAIKATYSTMIWSRGVADGHGDATIGFGNERYGSSDKIASTVVYSSLSNGGEDEMEAGVAPYADYTGFIVYSIRNINYEANKDSYIAAMLTLHPAEGADVATSIYAVKVEKNGAGTASTKTFSFANDKDGFFLTGTIDGANKEVNPDSPTRGDGNATSFTTDLQEGDNFLVAQKTASAFKVWDGSCLAGAEASTYFDGSCGLIALKDDCEGNYRFYLNTSDKIYVTNPATSNVGTTYYLRGAMNSWTGAAGDEFKTDGSWNNIGVLLNVSIEANQEFKVAVNDSWTTQWNYWGYQISGEEHWRGSGISNVIGGASGNFEAAEGNNIKCTVTGTYNLFITDLYYLSIELVA